MIKCKDFSELNDVQTTFSFDANSIAGIKMKTKISAVTVTVDLSSFESKTITLDASKIETSNASNKKVQLNTKSLTVRIAGTSDAVKNVSESDISLVLKIDDEAVAGENQKLPLSVKLTGQSDCWIVGQYLADVTLS